MIKTTVKEFQNKVALIGPDGKSTPKRYKVLGLDGQTARIEDVQTGQVIRIHKSRIMKEEEMSLSCPKCGKEMASKSGLTLHQKKCEGKQAPKPKPKKQEDEFDVLGFVGDNGSELWIKSVKFDHSNIKVIGHQVMNEEAGYYYSFNTYNGTLGKSGRGVTKYPLKGRSVNYTVSDNSQKKNSRGDKRVRKGKKTAEQVRKLWQKNGYKKQK